MDFAHEWTAFALEAEYEDFGPGRIVKAHNARLADLTRELEDARQAEQRAHDRADHWTAEAAKLADQLAERTRERDEAKAEARRWKARAKDAEEEIDGRGRSASTEAMWKERQGDDYGSY